MAPVHRVEATDTMLGNLGFRAFLQVNLNPFARSKSLESSKDLKNMDKNPRFLPV